MDEKLAIKGGTPAVQRPFPPMFPGGMEIGAEEERAVIEVLRSKRLFRYYGPLETPSKVAEFEEKFAERVGVKYALGVTSGTAALIAGLVGIGIGPGDEVIVPAYTFIASATAILAVNAIPVIVEVDDSLTLDPEAFEAAITPQTKAVMPVHMRGIPAQMDKIMDIARKHNLKVIEDVAQSDGGSFRGRRLGSIGDVGGFSLQYHKIITTGEGGIVTTDDEEVMNRARQYHDDACAFRETGEMSLIPIPGVNYRMNEISGALGLVQLKKLDGLLAKMWSYKAKIKEATREFLGIQFRRIPDEDGDTGICLMFFLPTVEKAKEIATALRAEGVIAGTWYSKDVPDWHVYAHWKHILQKKATNRVGCPYTCPYYKGSVEYSEDMCPKTLDYLGRVIHMNISPMLTKEDVEQIIYGMRKVFKALL